jgi:hypothetical protein
VTTVLFLVIEQVKLFARLKAHRFAGCDTNFSAGAGVAPNAGLARADIKDSESAQFDALTFGESALQSLEHGVDSSLGLIPLQAGALNHLVNDVLFYQGFPPSGELSVLRVIVETFDGIVNAARVP